MRNEKSIRGKKKVLIIGALGLAISRTWALDNDAVIRNGFDDAVIETNGDIVEEPLLID